MRDGIIFSITKLSEHVDNGSSCISSALTLELIVMTPTIYSVSFKLITRRIIYFGSFIIMYSSFLFDQILALLLDNLVHRRSIIAAFILQVFINIATEL